MNAPTTNSVEKISAEAVAQAMRFPPSATRVLPLLKRHLVDINVDIQQIIDLVRLDPGISARVLHAANCTGVSRGVRCHSVAVAVNRIGFNPIFEIVANAVAEQVVVQSLVSYSLEADEFWRRSVVCGLAAEHLAELCDADGNVAYTSGLLHGVGMVAVDQWVQRHMPTLGFFGRGFPNDFSDGERVLLGFTSAEAGAAVLRGWEFPPEMSEPIRWQHAPLTVVAHRQLNCILYAAKWLMARVCAGDKWSGPAPDNRLLAPIKFTATTLGYEITAVQDKLEAVQRCLGLDIPAEVAS
jgi:HD-like signal output (HDOD) protein